MGIRRRRCSPSRRSTAATASTRDNRALAAGEVLTALGSAAEIERLNASLTPAPS